METKSIGSAIGETGEHLIDVKAVAERLCVSTAMVWRMRDAGKLPRAVRLGKCVRWSARLLDEWMRDGCPNLDGRNSRR